MITKNTKGNCAVLIRRWLSERGVYRSGIAYVGLAKAFDRHPDCPQELKQSAYYAQNRRRAIFEYLALKQGAVIEPIRQPAPRVKVKKNVKQNINFYESDEWRALRYRVLVHYGRRCMCCGMTPADGKKMHVDHIKPRSRFPELELAFSNLQVLCEDCNLGKMARDQTDFRGELKLVDRVDVIQLADLRERGL